MMVDGAPYEPANREGNRLGYEGYELYVDIGPPRKLEALLPKPMSDSEIVTVGKRE